MVAICIACNVSNGRVVYHEQGNVPELVSFFSFTLFSVDLLSLSPSD